MEQNSKLIFHHPTDQLKEQRIPAEIGLISHDDPQTANNPVFIHAQWMHTVIPRNHAGKLYPSDRCLKLRNKLISGGFIFLWIKRSLRVQG